MAVFSDESFVSNPSFTFQLEIMIVFADYCGHTNILQYKSVTSKRATQRVLAVELFADINAFDFGSTLGTTLKNMFCLVLPVVATDSLHQLKINV